MLTHSRMLTQESLCTQLAAGSREMRDGSRIYRHNGAIYLRDLRLQMAQCKHLIANMCCYCASLAADDSLASFIMGAYHNFMHIALTHR